jgi:hypothetical protein
MRINVHLYHKADDYRAEPCEIEKIIEVSGDEFALLYREPLREFDFIAENKEGLACDENGVSHCLLVLGEGSDDGILICAEGYDYARYSTHIPNARQLVAQEQRPACLKKLEQSLNNAADEMVSRALAYGGEGAFRVLASDLMDEHGLDERYIPLFIEVLGERTEAFEFEDIGGEIFCCRTEPEQTEKLPGPSPLPFSRERSNELLDKALDWLGTLEHGGELYNTLVEKLNMSDEEISEAGFETLSEYFEEPGEDENAGITME